jgi:hypothetical protein
LQEIADGCRIEVDTGNILHHDVIGSAAGLDKLIGCGYTLNEVNRAIGQHAVPGGDVRFITKNYQTMEQALEGGEDNG